MSNKYKHAKRGEPSIMRRAVSEARPLKTGLSKEHKTMSITRRALSVGQNEPRVTRRMQASIIDFIVAFVVFVSIFIIDYYSWNSVMIKVNNNEDNHYFQTSVNQAVDTLIKTTGEPNNWEESTPITTGLAISDNYLSNSKLKALNESDYELNKNSILSTGDYEITISNNSGIIYQTGLTPKGSIIKIDRLVKINNSYYTFTFKGWRK